MSEKLSVLYSRGSVGITAPLVSVETHVSRGMPGFTIVGLPETVVKESKERVRSAIINSGLEFINKKIIINLAPADLPKEGGRFDLAIALGILAATKQLNAVAWQEFEFAGELALTGAIRPINGVIPFAVATKQAKRNLVIPEANFLQANLVNPGNIVPANNLLAVVNHLAKKQVIIPEITDYKLDNPQNNNVTQAQQTYSIDIADIQGQPQAKRTLEIAAAGGHNLLMIGPPGSGKTMLASRLPTIMPELSIDQSLEIAAIYSLKGIQREEYLWQTRPFRNPHHTISSSALVGGGSIPKPGEISLAHHGILFLDELPEFNRSVLEALREPLESKRIIIARAKQQIELPANFQLIAAMNPCPCGYLGHPKIKCTCTQDKIKRYLAKISGPLLDRIDLCIEVPNIAMENFITNNCNHKYTEQNKSICKDNTNKNYDSTIIKQRIIAANQIQLKRQGKANTELGNKTILKYCKLNSDCNNLITTAIKKFQLSARSYYTILKIARTIADLSNSKEITVQQLQEAIFLNKLSMLHRQSEYFN